MESEVTLIGHCEAIISLTLLNDGRLASAYKDETI